MVSRPALVISQTSLGPGGLLFWALMITNAARESWPGDVEIPNSLQLGLIVPSKVRTSKIASLEIDKAKLIGRLSGHTLETIRTLVLRTLG